MSMPLRISIKDGWYHVMARAPSGKDLFDGARANEHFLELLGEMVERYGMVIHAYCLMTNHYHLLLQTPNANLSRAIQWLNVSFSKWINARAGDVGHVFSGRFKSVSVDGDGAWAEELSDYIHLNPVRTAALEWGKSQRKAEGQGKAEPARGTILKRLEILRAYRWSSYRAYAGNETGPDWLWRDELLRRAGGSARYRKSVEAYVKQGEVESLTDRFRNAVSWGSETFLAGLKKRVKGNREQPARRHFADRPTWEQVLAALKQTGDGDWEEYAGVHGDERRDLALYLARRLCGMTLRELGEKAGIAQYKTVGKAVERYGRLVGKERARASRVKQIMTNCRMSRTEV
jgi:REP element-mobilizing transposase RayT